MVTLTLQFQGSSAVAVIGGKVLEMIDTITNIPVSIQVIYREHNDYQLKITSCKDLSLTLDVITKRQLRQNSPANNWETAWLNWKTIDQFHAYGFTLKVLGFQLEKMDNNNQDDAAEIYLITQNSPSVKMNTWQKWQIMVSGTETGTPRIQVWIDGTKIADYVDNNPAIPRNSETMKQGGPVVLYTEDAAVGFDNVRITPL